MFLLLQYSFDVPRWFWHWYLLLRGRIFWNDHPLCFSWCEIPAQLYIFVEKNMGGIRWILFLDGCIVYRSGILTIRPLVRLPILIFMYCMVRIYAALLFVSIQLFLRYILWKLARIINDSFRLSLVLIEPFLLCPPFRKELTMKFIILTRNLISSKHIAM